MNFDLLTPFPGSGEGYCGQNICYHVAAFHDSLQFDVQHAHVLKKLSFDSIPRVRKGAVVMGMRAKYLLTFCCFHDSL